MDQSEASYILRQNPLGIHSLDGADIVFGKAPRHATASPTHHDETIEAMKPMAAKSSYYDPDVDADDSVPTGGLDDEEAVDELSISTNNTNAKPQSQKLGGVDFGKVDVDFGHDFSTDFTTDLGSMMLNRKPTISARPMPPSESTPAHLADLKTSTGPSANPLLIQRMKSIRKQLSRTDPPTLFDHHDYEDDVKRAGNLPDDVIKMIAFSPNSPWLDNDLSDEDNYENISEVEQQIGQEKLNGHSLAGAPNELNPFYSAKLTREIVQNTSPSVTTLASSLSNSSSARASPERESVPPESYALSGLTEHPAEEEGEHDDGDATAFVEQPAPTAKQSSKPKQLSIEETDPVAEDDRGRLFLQINKVANLRGLPIESHRNPKFTLSLDNGLQTVTTEPCPLPAVGLNGTVSAKIGQEFELTVAKDLELVLTINVTMDALKPPPKPVAPPRFRHEATLSTSSAGSAGTTSTASFSEKNSPIKSMKNLLLRSPKKKQQQARFQEREQQERTRRQQQEAEEEERTRIQHERNLKEFYKRQDSWRNLTGSHGEFCRGYVFESHYEKEIFGKARSFAIPLYNEWDKSTNGVPRPVCDLQVMMMYVPKLYGSEQIPMSMQQCQHELELAKSKRNMGCEGFLTQQGGDCGSMWRRRFFTLNGSELVGHHEATKKRRTLIHLDKAVSVDDTLSEDLWCIYEDRSFQISFEDGEAIGFYADTTEARDLWMKTLRDNIANSTGQHRSWTDLVFEADAANC